MFIKAINKIKEIIELIEKVKLHRKQRKGHNTKIAESDDKPKKDKLKEKEKKECGDDGCGDTADKLHPNVRNREIEIESPSFESLNDYFEYGQRFENPQSFINEFIINQKINVNFSFKPKFDSNIVSSGKARIGKETLIGEKALVRDSELFKTLAHEEGHQRLKIRAVKEQLKFDLI
ncbi:hypothetical protein MNBD_GAMMA08-1541 [hydrothermal vent metagenome]|uniref:Uncharacterized protein n=1 Tax=hydrothermal vent metagenome TaxID=652676 RepID=A0A3B0XGA0_9ZZZZ